MSHSERFRDRRMLLVWRKIFRNAKIRGTKTLELLMVRHKLYRVLLNFMGNLSLTNDNRKKHFTTGPWILHLKSSRCKRQADGWICRYTGELGGREKWKDFYVLSWKENISGSAVIIYKVPNQALSIAVTRLLRDIQTHFQTIPKSFFSGEGQNFEQ